ncbi:MULTISPECIES: thermonuclease family protein [Azotobacter]|nr:thermonuclease family protein [Azotobacter vinelandii]WKN21043.1 thermonuclease family protein [Azotobacter vinelandii]SFX72304.1 Endonuclease YncB, thermonuclease family [Azotobacter vinelandii]
MGKMQETSHAEHANRTYPARTGSRPTGQLVYLIKIPIKLGLIAVLSFAGTVSAAEMTCKVIRVQDGDSLTCLSKSKQRIEVQLANIDAPELVQPYGQLAQLQLFHLVYNRNIRLDVLRQTRYGIKLANIYIGERHINAEMVQQGAAWVSNEASDSPQLLSLETEARSLQRGLWGLPLPEIIPPWRWRAMPSGE